MDLHELLHILFSNLLLVPSNWEQVREHVRHTRRMSTWISRQGIYNSSLFDQVQPVLLALGHYQLHVHLCTENTLRYRRHGTFRY